MNRFPKLKKLNRPRSLDAALVFLMKKIPRYWQHETGPELRPAVEAYLNGRMLTLRQVAIFRLYLKQWIEAEVWAEDAELYELRRLADQIKSEDDVKSWLRRADHFGIDPL